MVKEEGLAVDAFSRQAGLSYSVSQFEGPLDLLLHLIQKAQVNIYDISISEITDQFLAYIDTARRMELEDLTEFYAMAAQLLLIKSRMLLPNEAELEDGDEYEDPRTDLVERLLEYQKYKRYAALLVGSSQTGELFIQRRKSQFMLPFEDQELWNDVSVWDLLKTFSFLLRSITPEQVFNVYEEVTTKQKLNLMAELFESREEILFTDIVVHRDSPMDIICAFLAVLEAVKFAMITIRQNVLFGDIVIGKRRDFDPDAPDEDRSGDYDFFNEPQDTQQKQVVAPKKYGDDASEDADDEVIELSDDGEDA